jgi:hypothetical protein
MTGFVKFTSRQFICSHHLRSVALRFPTLFTYASRGQGAAFPGGPRCVAFPWVAQAVTGLPQAPGQFSSCLAPGWPVPRFLPHSTLGPKSDPQPSGGLTSPASAPDRSPGTRRGNRVPRDRQGRRETARAYGFVRGDGTPSESKNASVTRLLFPSEGVPLHGEPNSRWAAASAGAEWGESIVIELSRRGRSR